jgi:hypothetical protein
MGPNHAEIIRVYTREPGNTIEDLTLDSAANAEVVVEVEAGQTIFDTGARYKTGLVIKDLETGGSIPFSPAPVSGSLTDPPWDTQADSFTYTIQAGDLAGHAGNLCRVYAYLLVGVKDFDASFAESPVFLILP